MFLINRTPSLVISNKTPFEMLTHKLPAYSHLKTFGCLCYASTSPKGRISFKIEHVHVFSLANLLVLKDTSCLMFRLMKCSSLAMWCFMRISSLFASHLLLLTMMNFFHDYMLIKLLLLLHLLHLLALSVLLWILHLPLHPEFLNHCVIFKNIIATLSIPLQSTLYPTSYLMMLSLIRIRSL